MAAGLTDLFVVPDACGEGLAFTGARLDEAKLGLLGAAALAPALHYGSYDIASLSAPATPRRLMAASNHSKARDVTSDPTRA